ncbi:ABC transporter ATP-binding protein [Aeromicrobium sp.]|nr:ABC transporter ATP-binding protein [Candidatus Saccharibacteria bacterium]
MKSIWRIISFTRQLWPYYAIVSGLSIVTAVLTQVVPLLTKTAIDRISEGLKTGHTSLTPIIIIVGIIFACDIGQAIITNINGYHGDRLSAKLQRLLSHRYYEHILSLPQKYFDTELSGTIINRLNRGVSQLTNYMQFFSNNFLQLIFSTLFTVGIVAYYAWPVALILVALFPTYAYLTARSSGKWQVWQEDINKSTDMASGRFAESVGQVKVVKSFVQELFELKAYHKLMDEVVDTTRPQSKYWHSQDAMRRVVLAVLFLAMYAIIFIGTARGTYTIGTMVLLIQFASLVRIPLFSLSFYVDNTQRAISNSKDYFKVMDEEPEIRDHDGAKKLKVSNGLVRFNDVTFEYDAETPVLTGLQFEIKPNSKLALVGESGEGKTTITSLLLRLYEPTGGTITIDGQDINDVTQESLRGQIAVVFQEPALFSGTISENIAYARPKATASEIEAAAKAANAHDFIRKFDKGYKSEIGERGLKLSGGQKQRIAIARALLKDAPILILDEATSSLDTKSERSVQEALERLMKNRSTLIIAHRLSTIQSVDIIVTVRNGKVDEIGTPAQLEATTGIYSQLLKLQNSHSAADKKRMKQYEMS